MKFNFFVVYDNIIFELQRAGGISVYWFEVISRIDPKKSVFFGQKNENIFAAELSLCQKNEVYPGFISRRYLPFWPRSQPGFKSQVQQLA